MSYETIAPIAQIIGLLLFVGLFLLVLVYTFWPGNSDKFKRAAASPLEDSNDLEVR